MKKIFILFLSSIIALPAFQTQARTVLPSFADEVGPIITVTVELGRRKKDCHGLGICKIYVEWGESDAKVSGSAVGKAWIDGGRLHMELSKNSIEPGTFDTYFSSGIFKMEEELTLSDEVVSALGVNSFTIKAGNYTISSETGSNTLSLTF